MPFQLGLPEVIVVLVIALLFLGPKRLPRPAAHSDTESRVQGRDVRQQPQRRTRLTTSHAQPPTAHLLAAHVVHPADLLHAAHPAAVDPARPTNA